MKDHPGDGALKLPRVLALRMAAAFLMWAGDYAASNLRLRPDVAQWLGDARHDVARAIGGCDDSDVIARAHVAILALIAHKGRNLLRREELGGGRPRRVLVIAPAKIR